VASFEGIRWVDNTSTDNVFRMYETNSKSRYGHDYIGIEVQQLSKLCTAVAIFLKTQAKEKQKKEG